MASTDKPEDNRKFAEKNDASFPILSDPEKTTSKAYGVLSGFGFAKRWTFYIDTKGVIRKIDKEVKPRTAGLDMVKNLEDLKFPKLGG